MGTAMAVLNRETVKINISSFFYFIINFREFADRQGQSFGGQGLYFGWAGAVMLKNHKFGPFHVVQNFALRANQGAHPLIESPGQRLKMGTLGTLVLQNEKNDT